MEDQEYEKFSAMMAEKFPRYFGKENRYGGFAIGAGWYPIIHALVGQIDHYTKWKRRSRASDLRLQRAQNKGRDAVIDYLCKGKLPSVWDEELADDIMEKPVKVTPKVEWIRVDQIKEKFGGLRFYYGGGDEHISGMVTMAEVWAGRSCETCGNTGEHRGGGWIRTLCDEHEAEHQKKIEDRNKQNGN
jgi:hypothetical protein